MGLNQQMFAIKLYELEQQYGRLQSRIFICGQEDHAKIREELRRAKNEYLEKSVLLKKSVEASRSPAVAKLAEAQLDYSSRTARLLKEQMASDLHSDASHAGEDQAEAAALFAEYAIDFATQAMQYALMAALSAMDAQMTTEEMKEEV